MGNLKKSLDMLASLCFAVLLLFIVRVNCERITSCDQTPHPATCHHYVGKSMLSSLEENTVFTFHRVALRVTMDQAVQVHRLVTSMDVSSFDARARSAWSDCLKLYDDTIYQLNRSMSLKTVSSRDSQTWLSAAFTNHVTCQDGFKELNLESYLQYFPNFMMTNFSDLLSNSLAINKANALASPPSTVHHKEGARGKRRLLAADGFPSWVSAADRKLFQAAAGPRADLVVAKDGSGNFQTISEAVAASAKLRSGDKRFVIHVKSGTYDENVEIMRSTKNLMIVGDGIDATIVTGSRNAQDGRTFSSASFGKP